MKNLGLIFRTVRHLKAVQVLNRLWRKRPMGRVSAAALPWRNEAGCRVPWPEFPRCWNGVDQFTFLNETRKLRSADDWNRAEWPKLWLYNLHYFDCLRQRATLVSRSAQLALVRRWIAENPACSGNGWEPYPVSLRVVNWIKWLTAGEPLAKDDAEAVSASICQQMRALRRRLEYHLLANHLLANAKALVFAGSCFEGKEAREWLQKGMNIYRRELAEQILDDGVHFERSAMYHSIILEDVLDCFNLTGDALFKDAAERMIAGLVMLTGPDGLIAKFNDAAEGIALAPVVLQEYSRALDVADDSETGRGTRDACPRSRGTRDPTISGFLRKTAGDWTLLAKCGEIGPSYQPGHAHADTWTFELWRGARKLIGDTGCSTYVPGEVRSYERSTAAHNTVVIDGENSSEVWASHRVGRRFDAKRHERSFELSKEGLCGRDELRGGGVHDVEVRFHLPPGVERDEVSIDCPGELSWARCEFSEGFNLRREGWCAVFRQRLEFPCVIDWKMGSMPVVNKDQLPSRSVQS